MNRRDEIQRALAELDREELAAFRRWFAEFDAAAWDRELEDDVAAGRLDALAGEAFGFVHGGDEVISEMRRAPEDTPERRATFDRARSAAFLVRQVVEQSRLPSS
jgi:hypothetical protein